MSDHGHDLLFGANIITSSPDRLSGGRFELGLGAGAFWGAIEAMGARRLTTGQAVTALDEAARVIRETWDAGVRGVVRVSGEHYQVSVAKRGPRPAHDIRIWLGAYKPRMLRLTGRVADGWLPSLGHLQPSEFAEAKTRVDEAAEEAGRSPRDARRLLNLGAELPTDQLAKLALTHGSALILLTDDTVVIERVGGEVGPAVRPQVAIERARQTGRPRQHA
jgi:alkanesulfonate monooxygenase SsuD/methylene tetrahydromethanopterin reductase-like flavin-dependent oxidoreductase (luciferase family)